MQRYLTSTFKRIGEQLLPLLVLLETPFFKYLNKVKGSVKFKQRNNILITGGSFINRGAQAMIFTAVDQIIRRYPKNNVYVLLDKDYKDVDDSIFNFKTLPWTYLLKVKMLNPVNQKLFGFYSEYRKYEVKLKKILKHTLFMVDIRGYSFSSEMGQTWISSILDIITAKKYGIRYYLFPQSVGPFKFPLLMKLIFFTLVKRFLNYPDKLFSRERNGYRYMTQLSKKDIIKSYDMVLTNKGYDLENIFVKKVESTPISIERDSVGIIPNNKVFLRSEKRDIYDLYSSIIEKLIEKGKFVYLLSHSLEDITICENIKKLYSNHEHVILLREDFNVFELEKIISQFDFVIASRYHSIVNSYRLGTPAIVIGWAYKYQELMRIFNQFDYYFDIRFNIDADELLIKLNKMIRESHHEKNIILTRLKQVRKTHKSCFEYLMEKKTVLETRHLDLCLSCEACTVVCPVNAVSMEYLNGQFLPVVDLELCIHCGHCLKVCPGIDLNPLKLSKFQIYTDLVKENVLSCLSVYSNNKQIRKKATSGGLVTTLILELLKNENYEGVFVLNFNKFRGKPVRLELIKDYNALFNSMGSKYLPASIYNVLKEIKTKGNNKKYIIVGTACQIHAITKFIDHNKLNVRENLLLLGLFCDTTLDFNFLTYIQKLYGRKDNEIAQFNYRSKDRYGWPGHSKIVFNTGKRYILNREFRLFYKPYFRITRCLYCYDKLNSLADISFGDCYIKGKRDTQGKSNVIVNSEKGLRIFQEYSRLFSREDEDFQDIVKSQNIALKNKILEYNKSLYHIKSRIGLIDSIIFKLKFILANQFKRLGRNESSFLQIHFYINQFIKKVLQLLKKTNLDSELG